MATFINKFSAVLLPLSPWFVILTFDLTFAIGLMACARELGIYRKEEADGIKSMTKRN